MTIFKKTVELNDRNGILRSFAVIEVTRADPKRPRMLKIGELGCVILVSSNH